MHLESQRHTSPPNLLTLPQYISDFPDAFFRGGRGTRCSPCCKSISQRHIKAPEVKNTEFKASGKSCTVGGGFKAFSVIYKAFSGRQPMFLPIVPTYCSCVPIFLYLFSCTYFPVYLCSFVPMLNPYKKPKELGLAPSCRSGT
jgi:hypothetical protein